MHATLETSMDDCTSMQGENILPLRRVSLLGDHEWFLERLTAVKALVEELPLLVVAASRVAAPHLGATAAGALVLGWHAGDALSWLRLLLAELRLPLLLWHASFPRRGPGSSQCRQAPSPARSSPNQRRIEE